MEIEELKEKLKEVFCGDKRIITVYLFGSSIERIQHKGSDIDLGVLLKPQEIFNFEETIDLEVKITKALTSEKFDLVILNKAPLILKFRIISGKPIYISDDDKRADMEAKIMQDYFDFLPRLLEFNREYFAALKEYVK